MRTLLIDDMRTMDVTQTERKYYPGICALRDDGPWDVLYLDHDLSSFYQRGEMTGYNIMCWLEEHQEYLPKKIVLVTSNPAGRQRMQQVIDKLYK